MESCCKKNSLIDIVSLPIILRVPCTHWVNCGMGLASEGETRDKVGPTNDVVWVEEPECTIVKGGNMLEPI